MAVQSVLAPEQALLPVQELDSSQFNPQILADDLAVVRRIYADHFVRIASVDWDQPAKRGPQEWTLHETVAHLCALTGSGLESIQSTLRGQAYVFRGLADRYQFSAFNRQGIEAHLALPKEDLCAEFLGILDQTIAIARQEPPERLALASEMPIYNRPVRIYEAIAIMLFHAGLHHSAQVAEPVGAAPLWQALSPEIRQRFIGRVLRAMSLLYRFDLGAGLRAVIAFRVDGPGGGQWHLNVSPDTATSSQGAAAHAKLTVHLRETAVFCRMYTGKLNLPVDWLTGQIRPSGDLRLFFRLGSLFSVDARR